MGRRRIRDCARGVIRALLLTGAVAAALACGAPELREPVALSLLALGDTGASPDSPRHLRTQQAVAAALVAEDRRRPVDALVLLGDLFYEKGLREDELVTRVRVNLVRPYCRFLALTAPRSPEVADACGLPAAERRPVPLHAVLGNHDHLTPGGAELARHGVAGFVANWRMPAGAVGVAELGHGVSLVLFDSTPVFRGGAPAQLADALRSARGPWRILAAHHPISALRESEIDVAERFRAALLPELAAAGVAVQLYLAGHEHNLQLLTMEPPAPPLHAIAGGGSGARDLLATDRPRLAGFASAGYARIDLAGEGERERLIVTLMRVAELPLPEALATRFGARFSVDGKGRVREE